MTTRRAPRSWTHAVAVAAVTAAGIATASTYAQSDTASVWDGVYSEEQATRGEDAYQRECAACHLDDLLGDGIAPALIGLAFEFRWSDLSVGDLLVAISRDDASGRTRQSQSAGVCRHRKLSSAGQ